MYNNPYNSYAAPYSRQDESSLIQRVSYLLASTLLVTAGAAYWAGVANISPGLLLPLCIVGFLLVLGINFTRNNGPLGLLLLYGFSAVEGLILGPLLWTIARGYTLGPQIIGEAAALSAIIVVGLGTYAWMSSRDFGFLGRTLFWALIGLLVVGLISMFVHMGSGASLLYSLVGTAIFCGFVLYDVSNIKLRYGPNDYVVATLQLYLDFLNIFLFILRILMQFSGGGRRD